MGAAKAMDEVLAKAESDLENWKMVDGQRRVHDVITEPLFNLELSKCYSGACRCNAVLGAFYSMRTLHFQHVS